MMYIYIALNFLSIFYKDFFVEIQAIPLISRKVLAYGLDVLSDKERNNLSSIREYQIRHKQLCFYTEDYFNMLFHHLFMTFMLATIVFLFYSGFELTRFMVLIVEMICYQLQYFIDGSRENVNRNIDQRNLSRANLESFYNETVRYIKR